MVCLKIIIITLLKIAISRQPITQQKMSSVLACTSSGAEPHEGKEKERKGKEERDEKIRKRKRTEMDRRI